MSTETAEANVQKARGLGSVFGALLTGIISGVGWFFLRRESLNVDSFCDALTTSPTLAGATSSWQHVLHVPSNAFFLWRAVFPFSLLSCQFYPAILAGVLTAGMALLGIRLAGSTERGAPPLAYSAAVLCLVVLTLLFGADIAVLASLAPLPWMILLLIHVRTEGADRRSVTALALLGVMNALCAHQLAIGGAAIAWIAAGRARKEPESRLDRLAPLALLLPALIGAFVGKAPELARYPLDVHLVPNYGTAAHDGPRFGAEPRPPLIDRGYERSAFLLPTLVSLLLLLAAWHNVKQKETTRRLWGTAMLLAVFLLLDSSLVHPDRAEVMPLETLRRMLPEWSYLPVVNVASASALLLLFTTLLCAGGQALRALVFQGAAVALLLFSQHPYFTAAPVRRTAETRAFRELTDCNRDSSDCAEAAEVVNSPSYYIIKTLGPWVLEDRAAIEALTAHPLGAGEATITASHHGADTGNLLDDDKQTRWSATRGRQVGDEWVLIRLKEPTRLRGIALSAEQFYTDFPRGVAIHVSTECTPEEQIFTTAPVLHSERWQGALRYTAAGFPYLQQPHQTRFVFSEEATAGCILVRQIAEDPHYDWSVSKVALLY